MKFSSQSIQFIMKQTHLKGFSSTFLRSEDISNVRKVRFCHGQSLHKKIFLPPFSAKESVHGYFLTETNYGKGVLLCSAVTCVLFDVSHEI